uniref:Uncharacterized protein n=1 Tax=Rhizophora mucronata TaxID=61149 RepID=A0A2P2JT05_RHIMU
MSLFAQGLTDFKYTKLVELHFTIKLDSSFPTH